MWPYDVNINSANVAQPRAARRVKILFFWDADYAWRVFLRHVTLLAIVIGHRATPKNAAPWEINFSSFHFEAQRGVACRVAPAMISSTAVYLF